MILALNVKCEIKFFIKKLKKLYKSFKHSSLYCAGRVYASESVRTK